VACLLVRYDGFVLVPCASKMTVRCLLSELFRMLYSTTRIDLDPRQRPPVEMKTGRMVRG
jgi:hypothetical protein